MCLYKACRYLFCVLFYCFGWRITLVCLGFGVVSSCLVYLSSVGVLLYFQVFDFDQNKTEPKHNQATTPTQPKYHQNMRRNNQTPSKRHNQKTQPQYYGVGDVCGRFLVCWMVVVYGFGWFLLSSLRFLLICVCSRR